MFFFPSLLQGSHGSGNGFILRAAGCAVRRSPGATAEYDKKKQKQSCKSFHRSLYLIPGGGFITGINGVNQIAVKVVSAQNAATQNPPDPAGDLLAGNAKAGGDGVHLINFVVFNCGSDAGQGNQFAELQPKQRQPRQPDAENDNGNNHQNKVSAGADAQQRNGGDKQQRVKPCCNRHAGQHGFQGFHDVRSLLFV